MAQVISGNIERRVPCALGCRPALGGWGHGMGTEMLALLQHPHVFLPLEEGIGAPGCHWTQRSGHRLSTVPEDLDLPSIFSCLMRHVGKEIRACVELECHFLFTSSFSYLSRNSASVLAPSFYKAHLFGEIKAPVYVIPLQPHQLSVFFWQQHLQH